MAGLWEAASAVHCMQSEPEINGGISLIYNFCPIAEQLKHQARTAAIINKYTDVAFQKVVI